MPFHNILDLLALAAAIAVGRSNLKKQTIIDQANLIVTLQAEIQALERRIKCLEENGHAKLVEGRSVASQLLAGSGNSAATPETTADGNS